MANKYNAKKCEADNIFFASMKEARHYHDLKMLQRAGETSELKCHPIFNLELKCHPIFNLELNGALVCKYVADFEYMQNGKRVVVDVKGMKKGCAWSVFRIKAKLLKAIYDIDVIVV